MDYSSSKETPPPPAGAWWSRETVAVVTGANRGIGHALAARLAERGLAVVFRRLDVSDAASVADFAARLRDDLGCLDILVNNAAVSFNEVDTNSVDHAETVLRTNFHGAKMLTVALLPLFRQSPATSRILNISSQLAPQLFTVFL